MNGGTLGGEEGDGSISRSTTRTRGPRRHALAGDASSWMSPWVSSSRRKTTRTSSHVYP